MVEERASERLARIWATPRSFWGVVSTVDHKVIGIRYIVTALAFLVAGGLEALVMRIQLSGPERNDLSPELYDQLFSMHGLTMIFWYASPILSGFGNYLLPLMLGSRDMAFPRLNAFSYWTFLFSGLFVYSSFLLGQAPHAGWFAYVPYTDRAYSPGLNMDFYALSLILLSVSTTAGAINFIVTIFRLRAPGMAIQRMPLFMYSTMTTSALSVLALPALSVACIFLELDRQWGTHFFDASRGGSPLLWQHSFWFFGHPWVYVVFLPATGMVSMLLPVFARRPIVGYTYVALSTVMTGVVGMGVWVHHMFAVGMSQLSMSLFGAASMTISVFSTVQVFAWIATLWHGRPVMTTALRFALGFIALFVVGGLSGVVTAMVPFDWQLTDTYFVVAHLHYVLIGANVFPVFAALYYWFPKMTGRLADERFGAASFWTMFVGFSVAFFPMHLVGLAGMPRRIFTYPAGMGWGSANLVVTVGAFVFGLGILMSFVNFFTSLRRGAVAGPDPWKADTLEWAIPSPPPAYNWLRIPTVHGRHPLWENPRAGDASAAEPRESFERRETVSTSALEADPAGIAKMPEDSVAPLLLSLVLTALCTALLLRQLWVAGAALLVAIALAGTWLWPSKEALA
ncbi:MAG TPA: cytochrome c oxidase subunit I [Polyangiaceae bacterium]|jgi:cytochrome c oxidase subunit I|nr:cytochrome c oxidase subunit I [Polyangiaceae bacterium]